MENPSPDSGPVQIAPLGAQSGAAEETLRFSLPREAFADPFGVEQLQFGLSMADGSTLPPWLFFRPDTMNVVGLPQAADQGVYRINLTVTDPGGQVLVTSFELTIGAPVAAPPLDQTLTGGDGNDTLIGGAGNDTLDGGRGSDVLDGGAGDDTLRMSVDALWGCGSVRYRPGGAQAGAAASVALAGRNRSLDVFLGSAGFDTLLGTPGDDVLLLDDPATPGVARLGGIESIRMGAGNDVVDLSSRTLGFGDVRIAGGTGNDVLWSNAGNDLLSGGDGDDDLDGGDGNDLLQGDAGADRLNGGAGNDALQGGAGNDVLVDTQGNNILEGGAGADGLTDGAGSSFLAGGRGNDTVRTGSGRDVIAFNRGDGDDVLIGTREARANDVLSLGGGVRARDLVLEHAGNDLVVHLGSQAADGSIRLTDWFAGNHGVDVLQVVSGPSDPSDESGPAGQPVVDRYDFEALVARTDPGAPRGRPVALWSWSVANAIEQVHLEASRTDAMGGVLATTYAVQGSLAGLRLDAALATVGAPWFGRDAQAAPVMAADPVAPRLG